MSHRHWNYHFAAAASTVVLASNAVADTFHVPGDFPAIHQALFTCQSGDEIIVAEGIYYDHIDFYGKAIILRSTDPNDPDVVAATIITGWDMPQVDAPVVTCTSAEGAGTVLSGFTIREGTADEGAGMLILGSPTVTNCVFTNNEADTAGGGMRLVADSNPTVTGCIFTANTAPNGGGVHATYSSGTFTDCTIVGNTATTDGGGMYTSYGSPTLIDCTFEANSAGDDGGGMYGYASSPAMTGCTFTGNDAYDGGGGALFILGAPTITDSTISANASGTYGGGLHFAAGCTPTVTNCTIESNAGSHGGGIFNSDSALTLTDSTLHGNNADHLGGGIENYGTGSAAVTNCTFTENTAENGGGMLNNGIAPVVANCTFSHNTGTIDGGGIRSWAGTPATVIDSAFCGNSPGHILGQVVLSGQIDMSTFCPIAVCPGDTDGDGAVGINDFLDLLANWGACP